MKKTALLLTLALFAAPVSADTPAERRAEINKRTKETLAQLYKVRPSAKADVAKAYGYAVFDNLGINIIFLSAGGGTGLAHNNRTGKSTYMKMLTGGVGIGLGVKNFRGIFVFENDKVFNQFVDSGWEANAQASAAAKAGKEGGAFEGAITVAPGVRLYQLTEVGLALEATIQGTKYFKDDDLNK